MAMSLTVFLAICILGCDVLIYFLYEWAFGESMRIRKRQTRSRLGATSEESGQSYVPRAKSNRVRARSVIETNRTGANSAAASQRADRQEERLAYRRLAASFAHLKPRT
jgi:hypothetical protein